MERRRVRGGLLGLVATSCVMVTVLGLAQQTTAVEPPPSLRPIRPFGTLIEWLNSITGGTGGGGLPGGGSPPPGDTELPTMDQEKCDKCICGLANKKTRIIGGQVTEVNQYPWMALLTYSDRFYCGATLINTEYLLTASHCVDGFNMRNIGVRLMEHARNSTTEAKPIDRKVKRVVKHRGYDGSSFNNDIALLKLDKPVPLAGDLRPVCLPQLGKSFTGSHGVVAGWGVTAPGGAPSQLLNEVTVPIMSNADCRKTAYGARKITDNMLCAGFPEGKKDSCQGDSGGPLVVANGTAHHIVGVVSWGEGCAVPNYPGVYARVNRYITWIKKNTRDTCYCNN